MRHILFIVLQLGLLYWLSGLLQRQLSLAFYTFFKTPQRVVWALQLLFWPGVLMHEMAHLIVGRLLLVKTRGLTIVPKLQSDGTVQMGSVQVPKVDRIRLFMIGVAPVFVGVGIIFGLLWLAEVYFLWEYWVWWLVVGYAIFQIANNMFLSSSDVKGAVTLFIFLALVLGLLRWMGFELSVDWVGPWLMQYEAMLIQAEWWLWVPIGIDFGLLVIFGLIRSLART